MKRLSQKGFLIIELIIAIGIMVAFSPHLFQHWFSTQKYINTTLISFKNESEIRYMDYILRQSIKYGRNHIIGENDIFFQDDTTQYKFESDPKRQALKRSLYTLSTGKRKHTSYLSSNHSLTKLSSTFLQDNLIKIELTTPKRSHDIYMHIPTDSIKKYQ